MAEEPKRLTDEELLNLEGKEMEQIAGGHIVIHENPGKAYKLYCPQCGGTQIYFKNRFHDINNHPGGEGNFEYDTDKVLKLYFGRARFPIVCKTCGKEFMPNQAEWECVKWDPNDYSD